MLGVHLQRSNGYKTLNAFIVSTRWSLENKRIVIDSLDWRYSTVCVFRLSELDKHSLSIDRTTQTGEINFNQTPVASLPLDIKYGNNSSM